MPFLNTTSTTGGRGMLGYENRVASHWSLFTIVLWKLRRNLGFNEISGVLPDYIDKNLRLEP